MLFAWTTGATYWYVCEKRGLCSDVRQELDQLASISRQHLAEIENNNSGLTQSSLMPSFINAKPKKTRKKETIPMSLNVKSSPELAIDSAPIHLPRFSSSLIHSLDDLICQVSEQMAIEMTTTDNSKKSIPIAVKQPIVDPVKESPKPIIEKPSVKSPAPKSNTTEVAKPKVSAAKAAVAKEKKPAKKEIETPVKGEGFYAVIGIYGDLTKANDRVSLLKKDGLNAELLPHVAGLKKVAVFLDSNAEEAAKKLVHVRRTVNSQSNLFYFNPEQ